MEKINLGSLYLGNRASDAGIKCEDAAIISIGNTDPAHPITWVKVNGILVADKVICTNVNWYDLDRPGFIFGRQIEIDGKSYLCRSPKVGEEKGVPNEWDDILDATCEDDEFWHWDDVYAWGQESSKGHPAERAVRGYASARFWYDLTATTRVCVGFRPVLEPLFPEII